PGSASARSLLWHKAQPSRELAAILEAGPVTDSGDQCRRRYWANALDLSEALARLAIAEDLPYSTIVGCNSPIQFDHFLLQLPHERSDQLAEAASAACDGLSEATPKLGDIPRDDDAVFGKKTPRLVHQLDPIRYQATANPMNSLNGQLFN